MTDEERAEEYILSDKQNKDCSHCFHRFNSECANKLDETCLLENMNYYAPTIKQTYLDGLAEGRKELEQWKQEWQDAQIKANEEGFARTTLQIKYSELEKENAKLKEQIEVKKLEILELKAQVEKMKCCYNCKYGRVYFVNEIIVDCLANKVNPNNKYENCDKWELAK